MQWGVNQALSISSSLFSWNLSGGRAGSPGPPQPSTGMGNISYPWLIRAIAKPVLVCILLLLRGKVPVCLILPTSGSWPAVNREGMHGLNISAKIPVTGGGLDLEIVLN